MGIKQERYIEAYARIESSIKTKHYFEAITIEESIISDRLASLLESTDTLKTDQVHRQSFANLIMLWRLATNNPGTIWEDCKELISKVDSWRGQRNKYVHGLVKFPNQKANIPVTSEFIKGAEKTAIEGKELSNQVSDWRKRQTQIKRKYNKRLQSDAEHPPIKRTLFSNKERGVKCRDTTIQERPGAIPTSLKSKRYN